MKSSIDGGEMAIEIAIETEINVVGEWTMIKAVMIRAVIGKNICLYRNISFEKPVFNGVKISG